MNNSDFIIKINVDSHCADCGDPILKIAHGRGGREVFTTRTCECLYKSYQKFFHKKDDSALDELLKHFPEQETEEDPNIKKILDKLTSFDDRITALEEKNNKVKGVFHD